MRMTVMGIVLALSANYANAGCVGPVINGKCTTGVYAPGYGDSSGYRGSSGQRYDYNLNNPVDRDRYSTDLDAQRRDQMNQYNTDRSRDQLQGQRGGGVWLE